ncbi:MAG TPA: 23S rRNA (guanosine(2251)-2'-O)-methyltransferase RlmB [Actinomycetota bacterium]|nr:23S rRNA (guanosine(2251)-2'-O)-methyltransferase RlmB [Actinomycetota bacterium]
MGRRPVLEAVRAGAATEVLVARGARRTAGLRELLDAASDTGVPVRPVPAERIDDLAGGTRHQGVAARIRLPRTVGEQELSRRRWAEGAVVAVLDGVSDPHNVGAVARSAEAAGAGAIVVRRRRGAGIEAAAVRASAGALLHLPVVEVPNIPRSIERLRDRGFWVVGLDAAAELDLFEHRPPVGPVAVVLGSEGSGLSRLVAEACDERVRIPIRGRVGSLNVSVAAGLALFRYATQGRNH